MESGRQSRQKTESQRTRLAEAITNGRLYQTKVILTDFTNLNYLDDDGLSPLIRAFMIEDIKHRTRSAMVKLLINHNADVNLRDKNGQHVLNWACKMNKFDLVKLLLEKCLQDVELTSQDIEGNTPLIYAVMNNNVNMVKLIVNALKKFSLSVDHRNKLDKTAYLTALDMGFNECASILSQIGRASQDIKVNPFLDFFSTPNTETSRKIRVRSAPLPRDFDRIRDELNESKTFNANTENTYVNDSLFDGKRTYFRRSKKLSKKLFKSRKIHNIGCEEAHDKNGNTLSQETIKPGKIQRTKTAQNCQNFKNVVEDKKLNSTAEQSSEFCKNGARKSLRKSREGASSAPKTEPLLRILLNERQSQSPSEENSPRSSTCNTSCNQEVRDQSRPVISPTVNGYFSSSKVRLNTMIQRMFINEKKQV